jgi:hypothetical protein
MPVALFGSPSVSYVRRGLVQNSHNDLKKPCILLNLKAWLPGMDSNHDNHNPHRICKLRSFQWSKMPEKTRKTTTRTQLVHGRIDPATPVTGSRVSDLGWSWGSVRRAK